MFRCEVKQKVLKTLRDNGPMTASELSGHLEIDQRVVECAVRSLHVNSEIYPAKKDRKHRNTWAVH